MFGEKFAKQARLLGCVISIGPNRTAWNFFARHNFMPCLQPVNFIELITRHYFISEIIVKLWRLSVFVLAKKWRELKHLWKSCAKRGTKSVSQVMKSTTRSLLSSHAADGGPSFIEGKVSNWPLLNKFSQTLQVLSLNQYATLRWLQFFNVKVACRKSGHELIYVERIFKTHC